MCEKKDMNADLQKPISGQSAQALSDRFRREEQIKAMSEKYTGIYAKPFVNRFQQCLMPGDEVIWVKHDGEVVKGTYLGITKIAGLVQVELEYDGVMPKFVTLCNGNIFRFAH